MKELKPIGVISTPFKTKKDIPCQGYKSKKTGTIAVFKKYTQGLKDIEGFSYIWILYLFHKAEKYKPLVKAFLDTKLHGLFATRYFNRPNPIGMSLVKLIKRKKNILTIGEVDVLDKTPLLDIKPYVPKFDYRKNAKIGWLRGKL
ncbi:tRNA (N6-threonylcarbamoyladenosine(37)-N6)-methyltransferase TrmO [Candidatus Woesearchaeota archaeon]|nr:tRNA (N6-threonylcarbamoyladenosine(37)-N6)-methyltransferase TrmO [Candidatus Woesearchaeota archaeon]